MGGDSYPLSLDLTDRRVLVVGGGPVAVRKARSCLAAGARVSIVAPQLDEPGLAQHPRVVWHRARFDRHHLAPSTDRADRFWLVHTATGVTEVDTAVADAAEDAGVWCVRADDASRSAAWNPAVVRGAGPAEGITVAVTGGADPRRATRLRDAIGSRLDGTELPVARTRTQRSGRPAVGHVALVGGGPGPTDLITVRGRRLLEAADVVIADRLGPTNLLEGLPASVEILDVGKQRGHHAVSQERINALLVDRARRGLRVVRLKGGDPFVLGRGGEEALHCAAHGVPVEVVPGVTSAISVPAAAGIPVTHRGISTSFVVASGHDGAGPTLDAAREAPRDATLVLLMAVSALGRTAARLVATGRDPDTPVAIVERGWSASQRVTRTTLGRAGEDAGRAGVQAPAVVIVGQVVTVPERMQQGCTEAVG
ncbi:uroporphyrinogen-III C-methyltransferase [Marihabitans asiaticum]|uniref:uroporphyrinogen-III C-methyltransferase n=1 Tax=Marihabitans asiaticum TaxID=415218 RepID=A0A560WAW6_9MICO|nr:uroporphyrinogen-III C-methyltransferase [Marihabitans asiaticum]TWD14794.1 uroporphyrinogen-III C-methyltransferase [Marihabitans asiaticum]